jgi:pimeloyl-ACP methyl ester carboxylesterase
VLPSEPTKLRERPFTEIEVLAGCVSTRVDLGSRLGVYQAGSGHPELISPDSWESDDGFMRKPNGLRLNLDLFYDYRTNVELYPQWQKFLREHQPKTLIFWGEHDPFFTPEGGEAYLKDLPKAEIHRLNAGHFATEDNLPLIADHIISFYDKNVKPKK